MATGGIPRSTSQYADIIIRGNYPELDETAYAARATEQHANGVQAFQSVDTVTNMAVNVASNMQGETANAADVKFAQRAANFSAQGATFENRAASTALAGQNILNAKTEQNGIVQGFEMAWNEAKVALVASGADQATLDQTYQALVSEFQSQSDAAAGNFQAADSELKTQIKAGSEPSVPASMPSGAPGSGAPSLELPPELMQQMQGMLGQGMGMAQQLPQGLQGALSPLAQQAQGLIDPIMQAIQGAGDGSGNVNVTPEMLDDMLAGQETSGSGSGSGGGGAETPASDDGFKGENSDAESEEKPESEDAGDEESAAQDKSEGDKPSAPSPAASPVTAVAAPPASAAVPETTLSSDDALDALFG